MHGVGVGGRIDRHRRNAQFLAARRMRSAISPRFAIRILSNIGLLDDRERFAVFDGLPSSTRIAVTVPPRVATISLKVFIASTRNSLSPAFTIEPISTKGGVSGLGRR